MAVQKALSGTGALQVNVVTPRGPVASEATDAVTAPGEMGEFEVLPGHIPFLSALHPGVLVLGETGTMRVFAVSRGYVRVSAEGEVEVLVEQAVAGANVDADGAKKALADAVSELDKWKDKPQDGEWRNLKDRHDWARAQLDAHARS